jgi:glycosyltransferase involved in cell wall biosynthesis
VNILRIADVPDTRTGGMTRYIHGATDELVRAGHRVDLVFADQLAAGRFGRWRRFTTPLVAVREVTRRLTAGTRYDVVEIHEPIAAAYAARRRLDRSLPPLLVSVYALEARAHATRLSYARTAGRPMSWKAKVAPLSVVWQANLALRWADHVLVETTEDHEYLTRQLFVPRDRVSLQPGGVGEAFFTEPAVERHGVLFLGTWIERKGTREFVQGVSAVLADHPDLRVTVAGCGCPAERVLADFPEPVRERVRVIPSVVGDEPLAALYREHAVFAFPSTFEGLPLVLLEAAARASAREYTWARSAERFLEAATAAAGCGRGAR